MTPEQHKHISQMTLEEIKALIPEPTAEEKKAAHDAVRAEDVQRQLRMRAHAFFVLAAGTSVTTDIYGFRGHDARVVRDDGPADKRDRKVMLEKVSGRNAGEVVTVSRDRVRPVLGI